MPSTKSTYSFRSGRRITTQEKEQLSEIFDHIRANENFATFVDPKDVDMFFHMIDAWTQGLMELKDCFRCFTTKYLAIEPTSAFDLITALQSIHAIAHVPGISTITSQEETVKVYLLAWTTPKKVASLTEHQPKEKKTAPKEDKNSFSALSEPEASTDMTEEELQHDRPDAVKEAPKTSVFHNFDGELEKVATDKRTKFLQTLNDKVQRSRTALDDHNKDLIYNNTAFFNRKSSKLDERVKDVDKLISDFHTSFEEKSKMLSTRSKFFEGTLQTLENEYVEIILQKLESRIKDHVASLRKSDLERIDDYNVSLEQIEDDYNRKFAEMKSAYDTKISELHDKLMSVPPASKVQHEASPRHKLNSPPTSNRLFPDAVGKSPARAPHRNRNASTLLPQTKVRVRLDPQLSSQDCYILQSYSSNDGSQWYRGTTMSNQTIDFDEQCIIDVISHPSTQNSPQLSSSMLSQSPVPQLPRRHNHSQPSDSNPVVNNYRGLREDEFSVFESNERIIRKVKEHDLLSLDTLPSRIIPLSISNGQDFYSALRLELSSYNIPLVDWNNILSVDKTVDLDDTCTGNYYSAKKVMARALYKFLDNHKETIFDATTHFAYELDTYTGSLDGFQFLASILKVVHPKFRESAFHSSGGFGAVPPTFSDDMSIFQFLRKCTEYFEARPLDPLQHTLYVKDQISKDKRFKDVTYTLANDLRPFMNSNGFLPSHLCVDHIHEYLTSHLSQQELMDITKPRNGISVKQVITRSQRYRQQHRIGDTVKPRKSNPVLVEDVTEALEDSSTPSPVRCKACATYGHREDKCPFVGKMIQCSEYVSQLDSSKKKMFLKAYRQNREETHQRYLKSMKARKHLRGRIRKIHMDSQNSIPALDEDEVHLQINSAIRDAHRTDPDIDFGSLDDDYLDVKEPVLDFDSELDLSHYDQEE